MKKNILKATSIMAAVSLLSTGCATNTSESANTDTGNPAETEVKEIPIQTRSINLGDDGKARVIITTDLECDDQNSFIHQCLFFNEIDLDGIVISASQFHFTGDGEHTLEEVNSHYMCANGGDVTECRPMELEWLNNLWTNEYAEAYPNLAANVEGFPTPEELVAITKIGNVEFEGDVREDTEGSNLIKEAILDDDDQNLFLLSWGGFNTIARALLSIAEDYKDTDQWDAIYEKVVNKVILGAHGQDYTYQDYIADLYPDLVSYSASEGYAGYAIAYTAPEDAIYTFKGEWLKENIKFNHGSLNEIYRLVNDGQDYPGEEDQFQFGHTNTIINKEYDDYDFISEGDSITLINFYPVGLNWQDNGYFGALGGRIKFTVGDDRTDAGYICALSDGAIAPKYYDMETGEQVKKPYILDFQLEWAARADWCINGFEDCNHPPVVSEVQSQIVGKPGETVTLTVNVEDPDGDDCDTNWWIDRGASVYGNGDEILSSCISSNGKECSFTIPEDTQSGNNFLIQANVTDKADAPITRYAQFVVSVSE
ncbi:MAG: DUF1593 domain-containing protein [Butyrivibrio sp.]|nr:DUF1593 domain-containing protein [Butyrivibrio sp.]